MLNLPLIIALAATLSPIAQTTIPAKGDPSRCRFIAEHIIASGTEGQASGERMIASAAQTGMTRDQVRDLRAMVATIQTQVRRAEQALARYRDAPPLAPGVREQVQWTPMAELETELYGRCSS